MKAKNALNTLDLSMSVFVRRPPSSCNGPMLFLRCFLSLTCLKKTSFYCSHYSVHFQPHLSFGCTIFFPYSNEQHFCTLPVSPDLASIGHTPSFFSLFPKDPYSAKLPSASPAWLPLLFSVPLNSLYLIYFCLP